MAVSSGPSPLLPGWELPPPARPRPRMDEARVLARFLERRYGLAVQAVDFIRFHANRLYRVESAQGRFALRVHLAGTDAQRVLGELAWVEALAGDQAVRVSRPVAGVDGAAIQHLRRDGGDRRLAVLFTWVPGAPLATWSVAAARQLGVAIAELHRHGRGFLAARPSLARQPVDDWARLAWISAQLGGGRRRLPDVEWRCLAAAASNLRAQLADHPRLLVHGDLHSGNILWDAGDVAFIDFDDCGPGCLATEFAALVCGWQWDGVEGIADLRQALIDGYGTLLPPPADLDRQLGARMRMRRLDVVAWGLARWRYPAIRAWAEPFIRATPGLLSATA